MPIDWNDAVITRLKELLAEVLSIAEVANSLTVEFECKATFTKNAVTGKVSRLGLTSNYKRNRVLSRETMTRLVKVRRALEPPSPVKIDPNTIADGARLLGIFDLEPGHCRFIHGDPRAVGGALFCAADTVSGSSWCACHKALVWTPYIPKTLQVPA